MNPDTDRVYRSTGSYAGVRPEAPAFYAHTEEHGWGLTEYRDVTAIQFLPDAKVEAVAEVRVEVTADHIDPEVVEADIVPVLWCPGCGGPSREPSVATLADYVVSYAAPRIKDHRPDGSTTLAEAQHLAEAYARRTGFRATVSHPTLGTISIHTASVPTGRLPHHWETLDTEPGLAEADCEACLADEAEFEFEGRR